MRFRINTRELPASALMLALGIAAAVGGANYSIGTLSRMGPGFFPVALGIILIVLSLLMALAPADGADPVARRARSPGQYRAWLCVASGVIAFIVLCTYAGLVPGAFALAFIAALGDKGNSLRTAVVIGAVVCAMAVGLFRMLLQIQIPLFVGM